jgi:hypothetical protein
MAALAAGASFLPQVVGGLGAMKVAKARKPAPAIPMPDIEELQRNKRRTAAASRGRASTVLTSTDGLGG